MKFQLTSTQLIIDEKESQAQGRATATGTAGHNPPNCPSSSLFHVSLSLSRSDASLARVRSCILHSAYNSRRQGR
jgi:hypothetical protein